VVDIAERIWSAWRENAEHDTEWYLELLLSAVGDNVEAERALGESVLEVQRVYADEPPRADERDPPSPGEWDWLRVSDGVLVTITECDRFDSVLREVAAGLERRGISGAFDLWEQPPGVPPPRKAPLLECRVRVGGQRLRRGPRDYRWQADPDAYEVVLAAADRWCRQQPDRAAHSLSVGTIGWVAIKAHEDVRHRMRDAVDGGRGARLAAVAGDEFRAVAAHTSGGISLVVGGSAVDGDRWRRELAELTGVLREHADLLAYGHVMRGWQVSAALLGDPLSYDWPSRADDRPRGIGFTAEAFDDLYAPDAFGVQLLGPGYADRLPDSAAWQANPVGSSAVLLEHVDPPAWFEAPFVPFDQQLRPEDRPQPEFLTRGRAELAPILYSPGVLSRAGYLDIDGHW
jgi:hypothetical protein